MSDDPCVVVVGRSGNPMSVTNKLVFCPVLTSRDVLRVVAHAVGVTPEVIIEANRNCELLFYARCLAIYMARAHVGSSWNRIAGFYGKHHTTVMAAAQTAVRLRHKATKNAQLWSKVEEVLCVKSS